MADITLKDYWVIAIGDGWIKVDESTADIVMKELKDPNYVSEFYGITDMFGSYCFIRLSRVDQVFHINEDIIRLAARHTRWADNINENARIST